MGLPLGLPDGCLCVGHGPCDFLSGRHCLSLLCPAASRFPFLLQAVASAAQASLLRQQEELDRKAAELERKERELQNTVANLHGKGGRLRSWVTRPGAREFPQPACSWGSLRSLLGS